MSSPLALRAPKCLSCIRRINYCSEIAKRQHIRGKKTVAKVQTVQVRLLQDIPKYGKKGAILPVLTGVMRNIWYPSNMAEYMTKAKLKAMSSVEQQEAEPLADPSLVTSSDESLAHQLEEAPEKAEELLADPESFNLETHVESSEIESERAAILSAIETVTADPSAQLEESQNILEPISNSGPKEDASLATPVEKEASIDARLVPEEQAPAVKQIVIERKAPVESKPVVTENVTALLDRLVPDGIEFHRVIIPVPDVKPRKISRSLPASVQASMAAAAAAAERQVVIKRANADLEEKLSAADIAAAMNYRLAGHQVSVAPEDIYFVGIDNQDGLKTLGTFEVEIKLQGSGSVKRSITVKAQT